MLVPGLAPVNPSQGSGGLLWSLGPLRSAAATPMMGAREWLPSLIVSARTGDRFRTG